mmetsp:Transcript_84479/g.123588  ORF Transcript_84479/g.123588 Transcript_84479/m.123588 type:complete len:413 (+) Transcript_84479:639-1877(+)
MKLGKDKVANGHQVGCHQLLLVQLDNINVHLCHDSLNELHCRLEEGPLCVHLLERVQVACLDLGLEGRAHTKPNRQMKAGLGPREHPRDGTEGLNAALGAALGRTRAEVEALELLLRCDGPKVVDKVGRLVDHLLVGGARGLGHALHDVTVHGLGGSGWHEGGLQDSSGVALKRQLARRPHAKVALNHLTLDRDAQIAADRAGRLGQDGEVLGPSPSANGASSTVEEVERHLVFVSHCYQLLLGLVELPNRGQAARILGRVGIAQHDLLVLAAHNLKVCPVPFVLEEREHRTGRIDEILLGLEQRRHAQVRRAPSLLLQQVHLKHVRRRARHRDNVGAKRLSTARSNDIKGVHHLAHIVSHIGVPQLPIANERAAVLELCRQPLHPLLLGPVRVLTNAEVGSDGINDLFVAC